MKFYDLNGVDLGHSRTGTRKCMRRDNGCRVYLTPLTCNVTTPMSIAGKPDSIACPGF